MYGGVHNSNVRGVMVILYYKVDFLFELIYRAVNEPNEHERNLVHVRSFNLTNGSRTDKRT